MDAEDIRYAMQQKATVSPDEISGASLRDAGCLDRVCVLPEQFNERVRYLANVLVRMLTRKPEDDQLRATVGQLCQSLSYMMNSASWRDGELHDFDLLELQMKLGRFVNPRIPLSSKAPVSRPAETE